MAQQDNNKNANTSKDIKTGDKPLVDRTADQAGKPGEHRATGDKTAPQNQGDKADANRQAAK